MNGSRTTFEPLNNIKLLEAQFSLNIADRQKARMAFDLFEQFNIKDLVELPFENSEWPSEFLSEQGLLQRQVLTWIPSKKKVPRSLLPPAGIANTIYTLGDAKYMKEVQQFILDIASDLSIHHHCWNYLRRDEIINAISSGVFATDKYAGFGIRLLHAFVWLAQEESRYPY